MGFLLPDMLIAILTISSACSLKKSPDSKLIKIPSGLIHLIKQASQPMPFFFCISPFYNSWSPFEKTKNVGHILDILISAVGYRWNNRVLPH